ncbi:MAG: UbiD family decarboxylase [Desulfobacterales bacterium]|nr:UbiD family decarboxylase [Desulfobacterales bacterium]
MAYYKDFREHLQALEAHGKLTRIKRTINKDTQLHPLVRLQFRGLPEQQRKAFLFENVVDAKGRTYPGPVAVGAIAGSTEIYAIGMMCRPDEIVEKWLQAQVHPIEPRVIATGPVQDEVHMGESLLEHGGLGEFPIPISTPGFDNAPYFSSPYWISRDPETGIRNVGTYRVMVKAPARTGIYFGGKGDQHIEIHWRRCREKRVRLQAAIVVGAPPNIGYLSVSKIPFGVDELAVAGGIAGEAVELVKCKTVDLEVPAYAEIAIEGEFSLDEVEPEAPFGEAGGYMGERMMMPIFNVTCITHRKNPIWQSFISQLAPSESSKIKQIAWQNNLYKYLKHDLNLPEVLQVAFHEEASLVGNMAVIQVGKMERPEIWQMLDAVSRHRAVGKMVIVVDKDINPWDNDALNWALSTRMMPNRDIKIVEGRAVAQDHSAERPGHWVGRDPSTEVFTKGARLLIDATMKWPYPPVSLPKKEFMEEALRIWEQEGLPPLNLKEPWYGYNLGYWSDEDEQEARLAVRGEHYRTGEALIGRRNTLAKPKT